jgi:hypothetical protein
MLHSSAGGAQLAHIVHTRGDAQLVHIVVHSATGDAQIVHCMVHSRHDVLHSDAQHVQILQVAHIMAHSSAGLCKLPMSFSTVVHTLHSKCAKHGHVCQDWFIKG